ncbi:MAG: hypothetical protein AAGF11_33445 [Myxococcota bacterium]
MLGAPLAGGCGGDGGLDPPTTTGSTASTSGTDAGANSTDPTASTAPTAPTDSDDSAYPTDSATSAVVSTASTTGEPPESTQSTTEGTTTEGSTTEGSTTTAGIEQACAQGCAVEFSCGTEWTSEQECVTWCEANLEKAYEFSPFCRDAWAGVSACLGTLTCEEFAEWHDPAMFPYPCSETDAILNVECKGQ